MKVEKHITIHLNEAEADALTKLLGAQNETSNVKLGLTWDEAELMTKLWEALAKSEEQE